MNRGSPSVTVLGLGAMGGALTAALLAGGQPTTVWNRTAARADAFVEQGAARGATPADAISASDVVITCLFDYASVDEVLRSAAGMLGGRTVVNVTNGAPAQARNTGAWVSAEGAEYVDGGIMAVPPMIGQEDAFILYSGSHAGFERAKSALTTLARPVFLGADPGLASLYDFALLSAMYGMFAGAHHAVELLASEGIGAEPFTTELLKPWLEAMMVALPPDPASDDSNAAMQIVALENMLAASREQAIDDELLGHLKASLHVLRRAA
jgi:3-hydroxyisobutyrate dehydrogenase-like beta-hydroxyacid dehydrogenase